MRHDTEAYLGLRRFATALKGNSNVVGVYGMPGDRGMHAWVVVDSLTWDSEEEIFSAQVESDPDFWLVLHPLGSVDDVPADAEKVSLSLVG